MPVCIGKKRTSGRTVCPVCAVILSGVRQFCKRADGSDAQVIDFITDLFYNDLSSHIMTRSEREDTMNLTLRTVRQDELAAYKKEMQRAFQLGAEAEYGETDMQILPEADIDRSLCTNGAIAYAAVIDNETVGGAIVVIDEQTQHNHLDFLFVKAGVQSKGIGQAIWSEIELLHPETKVWETCTPYFEKRNIHFYINRCGFHAVEFYNPKHPDPHESGKPDMDSDDDGCMFRFEKVMK